MELYAGTKTRQQKRMMKKFEIKKKIKPQTSDAHFKSALQIILCVINSTKSFLFFYF